MNEAITAVLREHILAHPEIHSMTLTDDEVKAMEPLTLRRCFYSCSTCSGLLLREDELFLFEPALRRTFDHWIQNVDFLMEGYRHSCPLKSEPVAPSESEPVAVLPVDFAATDWERAERQRRQQERQERDRKKSIVDLRALAEKRALKATADIGVGTRFGSLTVLRRTGGSGTVTQYAVRCDCGVICTSSKSWLVRGLMQVCKACYEAQKARAEA